MAVSTMSSSFAVRPRIPSAPIPSASLKRHTSLTATAAGESLSSSFPSTFSGGSVAGDFPGLQIGTNYINPDSVSRSRRKRDVVTMVIPFTSGSARKQPPPDLASHFFQNRIVYLGMPLVPSVTELIVAEFLYLQQKNNDKPIYLYINSTGTSKGGKKVAYDSQAMAVYDVMGWVSAPIFTLCVGNAWEEAALLLAAGSKGNRAALPSATIMIKEPVSRFQGQAADVEIMRKERRRVTASLVKLLATNTGQSEEKIAADIRRPKYFSPSEAVEYGIIDKVLYTEKTPQDSGVVSALKKGNLV